MWGHKTSSFHLSLNTAVQARRCCYVGCNYFFWRESPTSPFGCLSMVFICNSLPMCSSITGKFPVTLGGEKQKNRFWTPTGMLAFFQSQRKETKKFQLHFRAMRDGYLWNRWWFFGRYWTVKYPCSFKLEVRGKLSVSSNTCNWDNLWRRTELIPAATKTQSMFHSRNRFMDCGSCDVLFCPFVQGNRQQLFLYLKHFRQSLRLSALLSIFMSLVHSGLNKFLLFCFDRSE